MSTSVTDLGAIPLGLRSHEVCHDHGRWLQVLYRSLMDGDCWEDASLRYWEALSGRLPPEWPPPAGVVNWHWLVGTRALERVVDLGSPFGELGFHFAQEGAEVEYFGVPSLHLDVVNARAHRSGLSVQVHREGGSRPSEPADLVVLLAADGWEARVPRDLSQQVPDFSEAVSLLGDAGGCLALLVPNSWHFGGLEALDRIGPMHTLGSFLRTDRLKLAMKQGPFREVREYFVLPSLAHPQTVVPATGPAAGTFPVLAAPPTGVMGRLKCRINRMRFPALLLVGYP